MTTTLSFGELRGVALRAALLVSFLATTVAAVNSELTPPTVEMIVARERFNSVGAFLAFFVLALSPLPAAIGLELLSRRAPRWLSCPTSLLSGLALLALAKWLVGNPYVQREVDTTLYRHAGPTLGSTVTLSDVPAGVLAMLCSVIAFYWLAARARRKSLDKPE